ncbi:MAG: AI-2E family transporter [Clostridium sp.]|uniref:AI-2E family transporter n=1 Tax=Clostridium sp. TaxID=1506 RepID=UPI003EE664A1
MRTLNLEKIKEIFIWGIGIVIFIFLVEKYFKPFIWILILYFLGNPINKFLREKIRYKGLSAGITILFLNAIVIITILYLWNALYSEISEIIRNNVMEIKEILMKGEKFIEGIIGEINIIKSIGNIMNFDYIKIGAETTGDNIIAYFIGNACTFFALADKEKIKRKIKELIPNKINKRILRIMINLKNVLKIQFVLLMISTTIIIIGFKVLRIENSVLIGIVCGILDILPYVGTIIVFIPIIIYNIIVKKYLISFGLVCLYLLIQIIREILEAKLVSNKFNIHPLLSFLSIYIGVKIFGFIGIFIGPIFCMTLLDIINEN